MIPRYLEYGSPSRILTRATLLYSNRPALGVASNSQTAGADTGGELKFALHPPAPNMHLTAERTMAYLLLLDHGRCGGEERRLKVIDTNLTGMRCRATSEVRSQRGLIRRWTEGTIRHDMDNLGRRLISVQWDGGVTDYVFPSEIEIIAAEEVLA